MNGKKSLVAGGVVLNSRGEVLVVEQHGDSWSLPKGHVEEGETLMDAAQREIAEESGVTKLVYIRDLGSYERYRIGKGGNGEEISELKELHFFLFTTDEIDLAPQDPANTDARWLDRNEVSTQLTHQKDKDFFESIKQSL